MATYLWNLLALVAFLTTGLWGMALMVTHAFSLVPLTLIILAAPPEQVVPQA